MARQYILSEVESQPSRNGTTMWRLRFTDIDNLEQVDMTVDSTYRNFTRSGWDHVVRDPEPWGVYEGLRRTSRKTRTGRTVVSADSGVCLVFRCESQQQARDLIKAAHDINTPSTKISTWFEFK
jgi:hypothetical protein